MEGKVTRRAVYKISLLRKFLAFFVMAFELKVLGFYKDRKIVDLINSTRKEVDFSFSPVEAFTVYSIAKAQTVLDGDMAEVGVYQGGSARLICEAKGNRKLHLFDTFEGLHNVSDSDTHFEGIRCWKEKQFSRVDLESVKSYLSEFDNVFFYKGEFPTTCGPVEDSVFSFVHLDADLYKSTLDCLTFFYPRLINGGIILSHDYHADGVKRAFREFFANTPKAVIELAGSQCIVIKY